MIFFSFILQHKFCYNYIAEAVLMCTHKLCFSATIGKIIHTPINPFRIIKLGFQGLGCYSNRLVNAMCLSGQKGHLLKETIYVLRKGVIWIQGWITFFILSRLQRHRLLCLSGGRKCLYVHLKCRFNYHYLVFLNF